jgi:hypothetical protein
MPGQRPVHRNFAVIDGERATHLDHGLLFAIGKLPVIECTLVLADDNAAMCLQIAWFAGSAMLRQIVGRGTEQAAVGGDLASQDTAVGRCAKTDADIERMLGEIKRGGRRVAG